MNVTLKDFVYRLYKPSSFTLRVERLKSLIPKTSLTSGKNNIGYRHRCRLKEGFCQQKAVIVFIQFWLHELFFHFLAKHHGIKILAFTSNNGIGK